MASQRWSIPVGIRTPLPLLIPEGAVELFDLASGPGNVGVHPNFEARSAIWRLYAEGGISFAEAEARSNNVDRVVETPQRRQKAVPAFPRMERPAPKDSRQYSGPMATTAARDDRLTPNAKAFLTILRARCGKGRTTSFTKNAVASSMGVTKRTIRRYIVDLEALGYISVQIRRTSHGMDTGITATLTDQVFPFYEEPTALARWLAETPEALLRRFKSACNPANPGVTLLTPINHSLKSISSTGQNFLLEDAKLVPRPPG